MKSQGDGTDGSAAEPAEGSEELRAIDVVARQEALDEAPAPRAPAALRRLGAHERPERPRIGEWTIREVGRRIWERPAVAVSGRLYAIYGLSDPWDPNKRMDKDPIPLGPVNLRLGKKRRQPAPHLRPKQDRKKAQAQAQQAVDPLAKWRKPASKPPTGPPRPPPKPAPRLPPQSEVSREFGGGDPAGRKLVGRLPVRPEVKAAMEAAAAAEEEGKAPEEVRRLPPMPTTQKRSTSRRIAATPTERSSRSAPRSAPPPAAPPRSAAPRAQAPAGPVEEEERRLPQVAPVRAAPGRKRRGGRFTLKAQETTAAPVVTDLTEPEVIELSPEPEPVPEPPVERTLPGAAGGSGMDDLFGMAMQGGRMKRPKKDETPT